MLFDLGLDGNDSIDMNIIVLMNGMIVVYLVFFEEYVKWGVFLLIMEVMKMEYIIIVFSDGKVDEYYYVVGELVDGGVVLFVFMLYIIDQELNYVV